VGRLGRRGAGPPGEWGHHLPRSLPIAHNAGWQLPRSRHTLNSSTSSPSMKIPLRNGQLLAIEAPVLRAYAVHSLGRSRWLVWCKYCRDWHSHGGGDGHREAHCSEPTPYTRTGYNLAAAGVMSRAQAKAERDLRRAEG
jgi:hypothetical protein